jgi:hypothetical protein
MLGDFVVAIEGLKGLRDLTDMDKDIINSAKIAVNAATRYAQRQSGKEIRRQIAFPAHYLTGSDGRLQITQFATEKNLQGVIGARRRATSLARFAKGNLRVGGAKRAPGAVVEVKPGSAVRLRRAFLIKLRSGSSETDTQHNLGMAMRTKNGERPKNAYQPKGIGKNLWLLYGPSVDAAFINLGSKGGGVARQLTPDIINELEREFFRQMERANG